ncbi:MAG: major facilitator superfamily domain-containing protein [Monoraphidium minutum]|nr:MAG: major facilitator superfamily domain-containing protein [Monoraphidium minutum]
MADAVPKRVASAALPDEEWKPTESRETQAAVVFGLGLGTMLEWYDFQLYAGLSGVLAPQFFPDSDPTAQARATAEGGRGAGARGPGAAPRRRRACACGWAGDKPVAQARGAAGGALSYWAVFAAAFVTRPLGSIIFGHIADGIGRKVSLLISLLAMGLPTMLIGCLPTYKMIGLAAPILLALLRAIQGIAVGGEYGTAIVYIFELAPPGWEGRQSSFIVALCNVGVMLGNLLVMLVVGVCTPEQLHVWGWRIPFLLVVVTVGLAYFLRQRMPDTVELIARARLATEAAADASRAEGGDASSGGAPPPPQKTVEEEMKEMRHRVPLGQLLGRHPVPLLLHVFVTTYTAAAFYSYTAWLPSHINKLGAPLLTTQVMLCTALVALIIVVLLTGWACDKGLPVCWTGAAFSFVGAALPFALCAATRALAPGGAGGLAGAWALQVLLMSLTAVPLALLTTVGVNIYPPPVRASGYNLGYSLAFGFVGGLSPVAVTAISSTSPASNDYGVAFWVLAWGLVSAAAFLLVLWLYPSCNRTAAMPLREAERAPPDASAAAGLRALSMSPPPPGGGGGGGVPVNELEQAGAAAPDALLDAALLRRLVVELDVHAAAEAAAGSAFNLITIVLALCGSSQPRRLQIAGAPGMADAFAALLHRWRDERCAGGAAVALAYVLGARKSGARPEPRAFAAELLVAPRDADAVLLELAAGAAGGAQWPLDAQPSAFIVLSNLIQLRKIDDPAAGAALAARCAAHAPAARAAVRLLGDGALNPNKAQGPALYLFGAFCERGAAAPQLQLLSALADGSGGGGTVAASPEAVRALFGLLGSESRDVRRDAARTLANAT